QDRNAFRARDAAGRLDRGHGADERHAKTRAQMRQHQGRGCIASNHDEIGTVGLDQFGHELGDARDELCLVAAAVGKESVVRDIDIARVRPRLRDFAEDGEAAKPGIEDEDARCHELAYLRSASSVLPNTRSKIVSTCSKWCARSKLSFNSASFKCLRTSLSATSEEKKSASPFQARMASRWTTA